MVSDTRQKMIWKLRGHGSASFHWSVNENEFEIQASYVSDALLHFFNAAGDLQIGSKATFAVFTKEPGGTIILFSDASADVYAQIVSYDDLSSQHRIWSGGKRVWAGRIDKSAFLIAVEEMAVEILDTYGLEGYRERWGGDFPTQELERLRYNK
ncbi:hypothetical protein [Streptomyces sp. NPDC058612]|uniref:hypothetical protein n=1 Tax=Streptomyces sp. NPDC058612 TaxID=3346555 RepID=UPI0036643562